MKRPFLSRISLLSLSVGMSLPVFGDSASWKPNPGSGVWHDAANWNTTIPNGLTHVATFDGSLTTSISIGANTELGGMTFSEFSDGYTFSTSPNTTLTFNGAGIVNNSGSTQNFVMSVAGNNGSTLIFKNSATAGENTSFTSPSAGNSGTVTGGLMEFHDTSNAGSSTITNEGGTGGFFFGGYLQFFDDASARDATLINKGGLVMSSSGGFIEFHNDSNAGNAVITNMGGVGEFAGGAQTRFYDNSYADHANITNFGGAFNKAYGGNTTFNGAVSAGYATITNHGGQVARFGVYNNAGNTRLSSANAGFATFINHGATVADARGGYTLLLGTSTAANGKFINNGSTVKLSDGGGEGGYTQLMGDSTAANGTFTNNGGLERYAEAGFTEFLNRASAGSGMFYNHAATVLEGNAGYTFFRDDSKAGSGTFYNYGETLNNENLLSAGHTEFFDDSSAENGTFYNKVAPNVAGGLAGYVIFHDNSSVGTATFNNEGGSAGGQGGGSVEFRDDSTAGSGTFNNYGASGYGPGSTFGGHTVFRSNTKAGNATIHNYASTFADGFSGYTEFFNDANVENATITNHGSNIVDGASGWTVIRDNSTAGNATITNNGASVSGELGAYTRFNFNAKAGTGKFINNAGTVSGAGGGYTDVFNDSDAENGTFTNNGGNVSGAIAGKTTFANNAKANNATLIANGGSNDAEGGAIIFKNTTTGGTAKVQVFGNGKLDISQLTSTGLSTGSIEGDGQVFIGSKNLTVGTNDLDKIFSGVIQDGGVGGGAGGSLSKTGTGVWALSGANIYTGGTTVDEGTLLINNLTGSGTGTGNVIVNNGGTLGGSGSISGMVTVNTGGHFAAGNSPGTFTVAELVLNDGANFDVELGEPGTAGGLLNDLTKVTGNITLNGGILNVTESLGGNFTGGVYRLIEYGGVINGPFDLSIGNAPVAAENLYVQYSVTGQINLVNKAGLGPMGFWDGNNPANYNNGTVEGGSGTWILYPPNDNWTDAAGTGNVPWESGFAVFQGTAGNVVVDNINGDVTFTGLQFFVDGYTISGGDLTQNGQTTINVGDGTSAGFGFTGTIESNIIGGNVLAKTGVGTLVLGGANAHTDTKIAGGTLVVFNDSNLGTSDGSVEFIGDSVSILKFGANNFSSARDFIFTSAGVIDTNGFDAQISGVISGISAMVKVGEGNLLLSGANTISGNFGIGAGKVTTDNVSALGTGTVFLYEGTLQPLSHLTVGSFLWLGGNVQLPLAATPRLNITGDFINNGGVQTFILDWDNSALLESYTLLTFGGVTNFTAEELAYNLLEIPNVTLTSSLQVTDKAVILKLSADAWGHVLQNSNPVLIPTFASFTVQDWVTTGSETESNLIKSLVFDDASTLLVYNELGVTSGDFTAATGTANLLGGTVITPEDFTKLGDGALIIGANVNVNGVASVQSGALRVNGTFEATRTNVFSGALLGGAGQIIGDVFNNGVIAPGNSPGTLSIVGNYAQSNVGAFELEIASRNVHDRLMVSGVAQLAGDLNVVSLDHQFKFGETFAFLETGTIQGGFDDINVAGSSLRGRFVNSGSTGTLLIAPSSYVDVARTANQRRVARAMDEWIGEEDGDMGEVTLALDSLSEDQYPQAFDAIAPGYYEAALSTGIELSQNHGQMLHQQLSARRLGQRSLGTPSRAQLEAPASGKSVKSVKAVEPVLAEVTDDLRWNTWIQGSGLFSSGGMSLNPGESFESGTIMVGADYALSEHFAVGVFASYQEGWGEYDNDGSIDSESVRFGIYATVDYEGFYANAAIGGGTSSYDMKRPIQFAGFNRTARGEPDGTEFFGLIGAGYDIKAGNWTFGPQFSAQYTKLDFGTFNERGADSLNLRVSDAEAESLRTYIGGRVAYTFAVNENVSIIPEVRAFWQHEFLQGSENLRSNLDNGSGPGFNYQTSTPERDTVFIGAGIGFQIGPRFYGNVYYNADLGRNSETNHTVSISGTWKF